MNQSKLPPISSLQTLPTNDRALILDALFEPSQPLHTLSVELLHTQTFQSYDDLIATIGNQLSDLAESASTSDTRWLESILGAHPQLGAEKVESAQSAAEQAQLRGGDGEEDGERLRVLNEEYERVFPGLRYVVFVNGRSRDAVMEDMKARIERRDIKAERAAAIKAICEIAADRAQKLTQAPFS
ncbi:hypothetical protein LTR66_010779 [Elasticomyces elasticus]|nr:hypothetical protein LTR66_010779 [Elasticomyces elasticus]